MPGRNKKRKGKGKKRRKGGARSSGRSSVLTTYEPKRLTFLSPRMIITMKYTDGLSFTLATVTASTQVYNLNSQFDPDRTGSGHQCYGYDQIATFYNRYRVHKARWHLIFSPSSASYRVGVLPMNGLLAASVVDLATFTTARENPRCKGWIQGASGQSKPFTGSVNLQLLNGVRSVEYNADDRFEAVVSASPSEVMVLQVMFYNPGGGTITINVDVTLEFDVDFHDPISLGGSTSYMYIRLFAGVPIRPDIEFSLAHQKATLSELKRQGLYDPYCKQDPLPKPYTNAQQMLGQSEIARQLSLMKQAHALTLT